jgi:hypothetical protein
LDSHVDEIPGNYKQPLDADKEGGIWRDFAFSALLLGTDASTAVRG